VAKFGAKLIRFRQNHNLASPKHSISYTAMFTDEHHSIFQFSFLLLFGCLLAKP